VKVWGRPTWSCPSESEHRQADECHKDDDDYSHNHDGKDSDLAVESLCAVQGFGMGVVTATESQ